MSVTELLTKFEYAHIQLLPEFNGSSSCNLDYFIARCDAFLTNFKRAPTAPNATLINDFLFNVVKSKLKGEACSILDLEANSSYETFKEKLIRKYGDVRDERLLVQQISNCYQKINEPYSTYYDRLEALKLQCKSLYKINYQEGILELKLRELEELCLHTFQAGIMDPYRSYLRYARVTDISEAVRICRQFDNDRAHENYMDQLRNGQRTPQNKLTVNASHNPFAAQKFVPSRNAQHSYTLPSRPQYSPQMRTNDQFTPRPFQNYQPRPNLNPNTPTNPRPFAQSNPQPSRPITQMNRPYPTPNNIGRRFSSSQPNSNFPRPMSGVSTIRGNVNSHVEFPTEIPPHDPDFLTEFDDQTYDNYFNDEYDTTFIPDEMNNVPTEQSNEEQNQDFHLAQQSRSKT